MVIVQMDLPGTGLLLQTNRPETESLWQLPFLGQSLDVMVPNGAVDVGGRVVYPHPPSGRLPGFGGGRQFLSDVLSSQEPEQGGIYSGHQIYKSELSPKEAQAYFLAKSVMKGIHRSRVHELHDMPVPANAHWVGMSKDSHGKVFYADASGTLFDKKNNILVARPKKIQTSDGSISLDALRKAYEKAGKYLKAANKPILHMASQKIAAGQVQETASKAVSKAAPSQAVAPPATAHSAADVSDSKLELRKAAATLGQIAKSLKTSKPRASGLAAVAKELADVSSRLGANILAHDGASRRALADYLQKARQIAPEAAAHGAVTAHPSAAAGAAVDAGRSGGLDRELRIEMDLHSRLFGRHGLCTRGAFKRSSICEKLAVSGARPPPPPTPGCFRSVGSACRKHAGRPTARSYGAQSFQVEGFGCWWGEAGKLADSRVRTRAGQRANWDTAWAKVARDLGLD